MTSTPKAFPTGFRPDAVAVARTGEASLSQTGKDSGDLRALPAPLAELADIDDELRRDVTTEESRGLRELRCSYSARR